MNNIMNRRVVVTGMGVVSPLGQNKETTWAKILEGKSGVKHITLFNASKFPCKIAAEVKDFFIPSFLNQNKWIKFMNRGMQLGIAAIQMAMNDSNLQIGDCDAIRLGISLGCGAILPDLNSLLMWYRTKASSGHKKLPRKNANDFINKNFHGGASLIAILYNARGPNLSINTACASSAFSIGAAFRAIQRNDADIVITGGYDSMIGPIEVMGFSLIGALSKKNDEPEKASRPFDRMRDGFVLGEGAAILILEELKHALARGARIYAEIVGYGASLDAYNITATDPNGEGAAIAMKSAILDAGLQPMDIDYINAHGTSTIDNDRTETAAIKNVFGDYAYKVAISSSKSMMGHLVAAAGGIELVLCILSIEAGIIPPTINYENPDPQCDLYYVPNNPLKMTVNVAMSNSFAFGGNNATLIVKKYRK